MTYDPGSQNPRLCRCAGTYPKRWFSAASFIEALSRVLLFLLHRSRLLLVNRKEKKSSKAKLFLFFILSLLLHLLSILGMFNDAIKGTLKKKGGKKEKKTRKNISTAFRSSPCDITPSEVRLGAILSRRVPHALAGGRYFPLL